LHIFKILFCLKRIKAILCDLSSSRLSLSTELSNKQFKTTSNKGKHSRVSLRHSPIVHI
jgi:hypothetical protein